MTLYSKVLIILGAGLFAASVASAPASAQPKFEDYFSVATAAPATPDAEGFIGRWSLLEPIDKPYRTNAVFVDSYLRDAFNTEYFKDQMTIVPIDGQEVEVGETKVLVEGLPEEPASSAAAKALADVEVNEECPWYITLADRVFGYEPGA